MSRDEVGLFLRAWREAGGGADSISTNYTGEAGGRRGEGGGEEEAQCAETQEMLTATRVDQADTDHQSRTRIKVPPHRFVL